jgi:hypothetical protein
MRLVRVLISTLLITTLSAFPVTEAFAGLNPLSGLSNALSSEQVSGPGVFNSPGHIALYGGNLSVHVPSDTVQFVSISPPSLSAGCGGISMYFGGFSFISGAAFGKLIQAIMQAAPGYVINLAIRTLCPECSDILTELQKLAQAANGMGQNACHIAKSLVNGLAGMAGISPTPPHESDEATAAKAGAGTGAFSGFFSGLNSFSGDVSGAINTLNGFLSNPGGLFSGGGTENEAASRLAGKIGNTQWIALTESGYGNTYVKEIIMAMTGFTVQGETNNPPANLTPMTQIGSAKPQQLIQVVEYGANPTECASSLNNIGNTTTGTSGTIFSAGLAGIVGLENAFAARNVVKNVKVPTCWTGSSSSSATPTVQDTPLGNGGSALEDCNIVSMTSVNNLSQTDNISFASGQGYNPYLNGANGGAAGCGLLGNISVSLARAVQNVANGKPMTANELAYVQMAPFPLYQLINDASVYPAAGEQLVEKYAPLLAFLISRDVLLNWVTAADDVPGSTSANRVLHPGLQAKMANAVDKLYDVINSTDKQLAVGMTVQEGIMAQIDEMNQMISGQAAQAGMAGNEMFTQSLSEEMG